mgnify:CR=1 FL=1
MEMNDKAQLQTIEGLAAALLITLTIMTVTQNSVLVTPQSEMQTEVQLQQIANDALNIVDSAPEGTFQTNLTESVAGLNLSQNATFNQPITEELDLLLSGKIIPDTLYNVDIAYVEGNNLKTKKVIMNGVPTENAVVGRRLVTLDNSTVTSAGGSWNINESSIRVVEVRLILWKV